jgi:hypothetical protein
MDVARLWPEDACAFGGAFLLSAMSGRNTNLYRKNVVAKRGSHRPKTQGNRARRASPMPMGLDLHVETPDGGVAFASGIASYNGFHEFRTAWARLLGFNLEEMDGFGEGRAVEWDKQPLWCFFDHSDCEGELPWEDAKSILEQARKDTAKLPRFDDQFRVLISACEAAVKERMPIMFC